MSDDAITVVLRGAAAERLRRMVAEEGHASAEDAVASLLHASEADDPALEAWLRDAVMIRLNAAAADPTRLRSLAQVRERLLGGR